MFVLFSEVLFHHLLPNVICSSAVSDKHKSRTKNQLSNYLYLSRDQDNKLFVEKSQIIDRDVMATNGVLHLIDGVIIPHEGEFHTYMYIDAYLHFILNFYD